MKSIIVAVAATLVAFCSAHEPDLTPPKQPFTPFFNLQVASSSNKSIEGWWVITPDYGDYFFITPNYTERSVFYQSVNWTNNEHPQGGSVLVRNVTDAVPYDQPGTIYTPRNLIAGQSSGLLDSDAGLPIEASIFTKSQPDWDDFGSYELDFHIDLIGGRTHFNTVQGSPVKGWNKVSACWYPYEGFTFQRMFVLDNYPEECSDVHLRWVFAGF